MPDVYKVLDQRQVPTTASGVYSVPSGTQAIVKSMRIVNTSASNATITLWQGGSSPSNMILPPTSVDAGGFAEFEGTLTMAASTAIWAQASAATSITLTIYGLEIS